MAVGLAVLRCGGMCLLATACGGKVEGDDSLAFRADSSAVDSTDSAAAAGASSSASHPVMWKTAEVVLTADDFSLSIDGQKYYPNPGTLRLRSDPASASYTTLELVWNENGREMRLFMYFHADAVHWWSKEIRTYNGQVAADWVYYYGDFFEEPLGKPYTGDLVLQSNGPSDIYPGTVYLHNLWLLPTFGQQE
jgi:hypothetical protein